MIDIVGFYILGRQDTRI